MPLSSLATVELQLIMQMCDLRSLLSFARCSHLTLAAASSDFAWRSLSNPPLQLQPYESAEAVAESLVGRFCDLGLRYWPSVRQQEQDAYLDGFLLQLSLLSNLRHLSLGGHAFADGWTQMLQVPNWLG